MYVVYKNIIRRRYSWFQRQSERQVWNQKGLSNIINMQKELIELVN